MNKSPLKWMRVVFAAIFFTAITAFFLGWTDFLPIYGTHEIADAEIELSPTAWHLLAHLQLVPALLGLSAGILSLWIALTLLLGRVYCSAVCPLGILQDVFSRLAKPLRGKKGPNRFRYRFRPEMVKTRWGILIPFLASLSLFPVLVSLLDPYSNFGRIAASLFRPAYLWGNNLLAGLSGGQAIYYRSIYVDIQAVAVSAAVLLLIGVLAAMFGRRYCNTICPVGTLLGLISRFSYFKIRLKSDCVSCGLCEKSCKGECIDSKNKTVDVSRCVACFNCLGTCKRNSILYSPPLTTAPAAVTSEPAPVASAADRRSFLQWSVFSFFLPSIAGSMGSAKSSTPPPDPSLPTGASRIGYEISAPILPPGASDRNRFQSKCTACHLCVSKCPANILRPSATELGLSGFLQPVVKFDHGFCNYDCTICTEVCPSHALIPKEKEEKYRLQIGRVVFLKENCVVETQGSNCGACAEHCPTGAVTMVPFGPPERALTIPQIDADLCVGCGACEYICPVRPYRAIYVDGLEKHAEAKPAYDPDAKQEEVQLDDFGF